MPTTTRTIPVSALRFDAGIGLQFAAGIDGPRRFDGVAYSGQVISGHSFWGRVIFDLATTRAPDSVPILIEHDRGQRVGVGKLSIGQDIRIAGTLLDNAHANALAADADAGFPWQLSVHIEPGRTEEIQHGQTITVNGQTLTGPLVVP